MRNNNFCLNVIVLLLIALLCICFAPTIGAAPSSPTTPSRSAWQGDWEKALAAAKQEKSLLIYGDVPQALRQTISKVMKEKYGIQAEFVIARGNEVDEKILRERRAGLYTADIISGGAASFYEDLIPQGVIDPIFSELLLPEVLDEKNWFANKLPFMGERILALKGDPYRPITINTSLLKVEDADSYLDLLKPQFKGKIIIGDPTITGVAFATFAGLAEYVTGYDYFRQLAKQEPFLTRDERLLVEWVARGKYSLAFGTLPAIVDDFRRAGAPVINLVPKEGSFIYPGGRGIAIVNKRPHPNATKVFLNWLMTREGQNIFSEGYGFESMRTDASTAHLSPNAVRDVKKKYFVAYEDFLERRKRSDPLFKEIYGPLVKK